MPISFLYLVFLSLLAGITTPLQLEARPTPTPSHQETVISNVSANAITVTTQIISGTGKVLDKTSTRAFVITKFTEITVNGQRATVVDLKPGMKVSVTAGMDASQAARINANG
jgi:hydrogenase maturation factor